MIAIIPQPPPSGEGFTPDHVGYLSEGVVLDVRWLPGFTTRKVDGDELVRDVALFGYDGHAARASGHVISVNFDDHGQTMTGDAGCAALSSCPHRMTLEIPAVSNFSMCKDQVNFRFGALLCDHDVLLCTICRYLTEISYGRGDTMTKKP